jgi:vitamin K-dependent gamma-carboxylase
MQQFQAALLRRLFAPIDIAPLVFFRIAFGALMLWEVWRYFHYDRIARYYVEPDFFFHYLGFGWVQPLPGDGMFWLFHGLGALAVCIVLGLGYRLAMAAFWLAFTYVFLLDQAQYLNHFYLISLVSFLMIFVPAHRALSLDALLRPGIRAQTAPAWTLWLLRGQMAVVYVYGGLAKLNPDWLAGEPMRAWMAERTDFPLIGHLFTQEWMVFAFSYGGLLLDLFIVPLLLWRRTRLAALGLVMLFHALNDQLFNIGIFPYLAAASTLLFLPPGWFRPSFLRRDASARPAAVPRAARPALIVTGLAAWFAVQMLLPLRHLLYPGDPSWTEEGHTLAWHMRLRAKGGDIALYASDPASGTSWRLPAESWLSARQFDQMKDNPHMILRFAHGLRERLADEGFPDAQIRAWAMISLNSRAPQLLIDPTADLARMPDHLLAADWILPLAQQPVPHGPVPALLVSRRFEGALVLVNIAESHWPLADMVLSGDGVNLHGADFGIAALAPGECVLAYAQPGALRDVYVPCNETGSRVPVAGALLDGEIRVNGHGCAGAVCVVAGETAA